MQKPLLDFCIVGAAKAGTSSLFSWLASQDGICPSRTKEPSYWSAFGNRAMFRGPGAKQWQDTIVSDRDQYDALFAHKNGLRGEATTTYLYDPAALARIREACPASKINVMLRQPVARMHSAYRHLLREG